MYGLSIFLINNNCATRYRIHLCIAGADPGFSGGGAQKIMCARNLKLDLVEFILPGQASNQPGDQRL